MKYPKNAGLDRFERATARLMSVCRGETCDAPPSEAQPDAPSEAQPDPPRASRPARGAPLALLGAALLMLALLPGATCSSLPERDNCAPRTRRCVNNAPQVCSHEGRWHLSGDQACSPGTVCFIAPDGRAGCTRQPQDGGAP